MSVGSLQVPEEVVIAVIAIGAPFLLLRLGVLLFMAFGHSRYLMWARHKQVAVPLAGLALLAWFWRESTAMLRVLFDRIRGALGAGGAYVRTHGDRPVVFVHGFTQDGSNWLRLRKSLEAEGRWTLAPNLGRPFAEGLVRYQTPLEATLELAAEGSDDPIAVVAHSMGGIVLRQVLARRPDLAARVDLAITLGSPHQGTAAARGPLKRMPEGQVLCRGSETLSSLPTLRALLPQARVVTLAAALDHLIYPVDTAHYDSPNATTLETPGHVGLLVNDDVRARVLDLLRQAPDHAPSPPPVAAPA